MPRTQRLQVEGQCSLRNLRGVPRTRLLHLRRVSAPPLQVALALLQTREIRLAVGDDSSGLCASPFDVAM